MTCAQTRECLIAFLDDELDAPLSIELQRHLDGCSDCAREAEIERAIRKRLSTVIGVQQGQVPAFPDSLVDAQESTEGSHVSAREISDRHVLANGRILAIAAVLALGVGLGGWYLADRGDKDHQTPHLAELLVADFEHFLDEGAKLEFDSSKPHQVADWLLDKTTLAVILPQIKSEQSRLLGGRKCKIDGRPAAFAVYQLNGALASLVAFKAKEGDLEGMAEVRRGATQHWVDRCGGHTVVACLRDGLVYASVSELVEEDLLCLMVDSAYEGD